MLKLVFTINKQQLERQDDEIIASYSKNFIQCLFSCKNKWSDIYKYALFCDVSNKKYIVDLGYGKEVRCTIPEDVLKGNYFSVSVFGDNRLTTTQVNVLLQSSGFSDAVESTLSTNMDSNSDVITTSSDMVETNRRRIATCFKGYSILKNPQHDEHLYK